MKLSIDKEVEWLKAEAVRLHTDNVQLKKLLKSNEERIKAFTDKVKDLKSISPSKASAASPVKAGKGKGKKPRAPAKPKAAKPKAPKTPRTLTMDGEHNIEIDGTFTLDGRIYRRTTYKEAVSEDGARKIIIEPGKKKDGTPMKKKCTFTRVVEVKASASSDDDASSGDEAGSGDDAAESDDDDAGSGDDAAGSGDYAESGDDDDEV